MRCIYDGDPDCQHRECGTSPLIRQLQATTARDTVSLPHL
jgi:hypothetical protein